MNYWITTQWPHLENSEADGHCNIYLADGREQAGAEIDAGDKVLIYESKTGPSEFKLTPSGEKILRRKIGKQGIVTVADVATSLVADKNTVPTSYVARASIHWKWKAKTKLENSNGYVPSEVVKRILKQSPNSNLRGFGDHHSGLKRISKAQYTELLSDFLRRPVAVPIAAEGEPAAKGKCIEGRGESAEHLLLKSYVASNPCEVLREDGVKLLKMEYSFRTGDRADIALMDREGRVIGVEIELTQSDEQLEGVLQAIKYRYMLAVMYQVAFTASRSCLVGYKFTASIKRLCDRYEITCREIDPADVQRWAKSTNWKPS